MLHSYLRLPAISRLAVTGFHNLTYRDKLLSNGEFVESDEIKLVASEVDRIYFAPSEAITLHIINENDESMKTPFLEISKSASLSSVRKSEGEEQVGDIKVLPCDVVFWNPWIEKSLTMADLDNEAYLNFVCVEPGTVRDWVTVPPQTKLKLSQTLTAV